MILADYNPLGIYSSKAAMRWFLTNNRDICPRYKINELPPLVFVASGTITGTMQLYDCDDTAIGSAITLTASVGTSYDGTVCTNFVYTGSTTTGQVDGYYYYKITLSDTTTYYTDMFKWVTTVSTLLKFTFSDMKTIIAGDCKLPLAGINYNFYLSAVKTDSTREQVLETEEDRGINNAKSGSSTQDHKFSIAANEPIYSFLGALGIIRGNSTIVCQWNAIDYTLENIECEKTESFSDDILHLEFKFIDRKKTISMYNAS